MASMVPKLGPAASIGDLPDALHHATRRLQ